MAGPWFIFLALLAWLSFIVFAAIFVGKFMSIGGAWVREDHFADPRELWREIYDEEPPRILPTEFAKWCAVDARLG